jgi:hypothetical protein
MHHRVFVTNIAHFRSQDSEHVFINVFAANIGSMMVLRSNWPWPVVSIFVLALQVALYEGIQLNAPP